MKYYPLLSDELQPELIILANGAFPERGIALGLLERWSAGDIVCPLVCCDGAASKLASFTDRLPTAVVGDLDSLSPELKERLKERLHHSAEQESNDLSKAFRYAHEHYGVRDIVLLGASGGREDHLFANITLLPSYAPIVRELVMLTDEGYFRLIEEDSELEVLPERPLSVLNTQPTPFSLSGVYWAVEDFVCPNLWSATLNRTKDALVRIKTSSPLLVYLTHQ